MKKTFLIDTNVLINDPSAFGRFKDNDVLIPMIVLGELDKLKKKDGQVGVSARQVARNLDRLRDEYGKLCDGIDLPTGGTLRVIDENEHQVFPEPGEYADDVILKVLKNNPEWILVTEDTLMRVKGDSMGLKVERYRNVLIDNSSLYEQSRVLNLSYEESSQLFETGSVAYRDEKAYENEYFSVFGGGLARFSENHLHRVANHKIMGIGAKNKEQNFLLDALLDPSIELVAVVGKAGCGKTLLSVAAGLHQVSETPDPLYESVTVARPVVSMGKDIGFLPGNVDEKMDAWMGPIKDAVESLVKSSRKELTSYEFYKTKGWLKVQPLSYIRGRSFPKQYMIIDEVQNLSQHEVKTIITRAGHGTKIILTGDPQQIDNPYLDQQNNGLAYVISKFKDEPCFAHITMHKGERSRLAELAANLL